MKEEPEFIEKVWGMEQVIVNRQEYCGKLLYLTPGATSSLHYHPLKTETFYCPWGEAALYLNDRDHALNYIARAKTILPGQPHLFTSLKGAVLIEISTHHDDSDVVRLKPSRGPDG